MYTYPRAKGEESVAFGQKSSTLGFVGLYSSQTDNNNVKAINTVLLTYTCAIGRYCKMYMY